MTELDERVRAAVFARLEQLRLRHAGRIPRADLMEGLTLDGQRIPYFNPFKGIFKPAVLGRDGAAGRFQYKYRGQDPNHPDNIALRQAVRRHVALAYLVAVDPGYYDVIAPVFVTADRPDRLEFELAADQVGATVEAASYPSPMQEVRRQYVTRAVMQRLHQQQFRRHVLRAYREQCAICRLRHLDLLDAAHILPDRDPRGIAAVTNGLGLCKIHHSAYDVNILGIDPDARVHIRADILQEIDGPMLKHGLQELHHVRLQLPKATDLRPNRDFLAERFARFEAA